MQQSLIKNICKGLAVFTASSVFYVSTKAATTVPHYDVLPKIINGSTPTHAIFLKCRVSDHFTYLSKGAILALPPELRITDRDFALVSGHGVVSDDACFVSDFLGNSEKATLVSLAENYEAGTDTDWALISFKKIKGSHIQRYDVDNYAEDLTILHDGLVSFAQARGLPENNQQCRIAEVIPEGLGENGTILSHDCRAIGGQSGSPITQIINGRHRLIGLHIGSGWTLKSPITGKPGRVNFMRSYDEKMSSEIKQALTEMK